LLERVRATLAETLLPQQLWGELVEAHEQIINLLPVKAINNKILIVNFFGKENWVPNLKHYRVLGSQAMTRIPMPNWKLSERVITTYLVNYKHDVKAYCLWEPLSN
jgi:hypothetical protein